MKLVIHDLKEEEREALRQDYPDAAFQSFKDATDIVLCVPLYVDGLPSQVIRFMERVREKSPVWKSSSNGGLQTKQQFSATIHLNSK